MPATQQPLISLENLHLRRGERELFGGLGGSFNSGELCWLRAPNGSGKTSLLRILAGLITPDRGILRWRGDSYAARLDEPHQAISYLDDRLGLSRDLSVSQNLGYASGVGAGRPVKDILEKAALLELAERPVRYLSTGQKKRVALARLLAEGALVWLLDEPANGLDTANRALLSSLIETHLGEGGLCLFASHDALPWSAAAPRILELGA